MRANRDFIFRRIVDENLLIPTGNSAQKVKGMIALTESGAMLYQMLVDGCEREDLLNILLKEYDVTPEEASGDLDAFLEQMRKLGILIEP